VLSVNCHVIASLAIIGRHSALRRSVAARFALHQHNPRLFQPRGFTFRRISQQPFGWPNGPSQIGAAQPTGISAFRFQRRARHAFKSAELRVRIHRRDQTLADSLPVSASFAVLNRGKGLSDVCLLRPPNVARPPLQSKPVSAIKVIKARASGYARLELNMRLTGA